MKPSAFLFAAATLILVGCSHYIPLSEIQTPDVMHSYGGNEESVITNRAAIDDVIKNLADGGRDWKKYYTTKPAGEVIVRFERNGKIIASAFIGHDWVLVDDATSSGPRTYSAKMTTGEHDNLLKLLGLSSTNKPHALDAPIAPLFAVEYPRRRASDVGRYA